MNRILYIWIVWTLMVCIAGCSVQASPAITAAPTMEVQMEPTTGSPAKAAFTGFTADDFLHTQGKEVVNAKGEIVYLRGTNIGGWLLQESWMTPTDSESQSETLRVLEERFGREKRDSLLDTYMDAFLTEKDLDLCRDMGMTAVRLPFWYRNLVNEQGELLENAFERMDWFIHACSQRGLYVILDMHGAPGSQNGKDHSGSTKGDQLWTEGKYQDETLRLWKQIAEHYRGNPVVAGYDLLNEPATGVTGKLQWDFYDRLYRIIRSADPEHIQIMEACWDPYHLPDPKDYGWENVIYSYHNYVWDHDTQDAAQIQGHRKLLQDIRITGYNVPSYIGEFTLFRAEEAWKTVLEAYNEANLHWTTWTLKTTGRDNSWGIFNLIGEGAKLQEDSAGRIEMLWRTMGDEEEINTWLYNLMVPYLPGNPLVHQGQPMPEPETTPEALPEQAAEAVVFHTCQEETGLSAGEKAKVQLDDLGDISVVKLTCQVSADPETDKGCIQLTPVDGKPVDVSQCQWLCFYIRDMQGANTHRVTLIDTHGQVYSGWTEVSSAFRKWEKITMPLAQVTGVDITQIMEVRIGEWNAGSYYFGGVFFTQQPIDTARTLTLPEIGS